MAETKMADIGGTNSTPAVDQQKTTAKKKQG